MSPNPVIAYESVYTSEEGLFDAGRARCGLYRGLASSLSQFLALEREDFNL